MSSPPDVHAPSGSPTADEDHPAPSSSLRHRLGPIRTSARRRRLAPTIFSIVPDGAVRRRPSDVVRAVFAALVVVLTGIAAANHLTGVEHSVYDFFTGAPEALDWLFQVGYWVLPALVAAVLIGALIGRHGRMVASMVLAAGATAAAGFALDAAIGTRHRTRWPTPAPT